MRPRTLAALLVALVGSVACEPLPNSGEGTSSSSTSSSSTTSSGSSATGRSAIDTSKLCNRLLGECQQSFTMAACVKLYGSLRVTASCLSAIDTASCADLLSTTSSVSTTCFPPCTGALATCNADGTITFCTDSGSTQVADCASSCAAEGWSSWSGECGTTYQGQVVARAQCWCR